MDRMFLYTALLKGKVAALIQQLLDLFLLFGSILF